MAEKNLEEMRQAVAEIREKMAAAAREAGRDPAAVQLCAACKTRTAQTIAASAALPIDVFGENHVQELCANYDAGAYCGKPSHFIGHLQTNKIKKVLGRASLIQSVDSEHLLLAIEKEAAKAGIVQDILLEVNIGGEESKTGAAPELLWPLLDTAAAQEHIRVKGLMAIPPVNDDDAQNRRYLAQVYHDGVQVTYPLYSEEEIAAMPARAHVELYYCPAEQPGAKFAIVLSGNSLYYSGELRGGVSTAWELHEQGYAVFSLRYRIGWEAGDDAPLEDLARAIRFVMDNADTFGVSTEDYALLGYSSGGQLAGVFGNEEKGWGRYGVPKPGVLLLAYPINNFFEAKPAYHLLMDTDRLERRYYSYTVSKLVTPDYPPTFLWYGRNDTMLKAFVYPLQGPTLAKALEASGVPNRVEVYDNAKHGIGIGVGTDAEDWVERAAEFWQSVSE